MSSKITKEDLKAPDTFHTVSDILFHWIERHAKPIAGVIALGLIVGIGWILYGYVESRAEKSAAEALYVPQSELQRAEAKALEARTKIIPKDAAKEAPPAIDYKSVYAPSVGKIKDELRRHASTKAALVGAIELAGVLFGEKQFDEALEVLNIPTYRPAAGDVMSGIYHLHRGLAELETKKYADAIKSYQSIVESGGLKAFRAEALLKLGVAFEQSGDTAKAHDAYDRATREFPDSEASASARQYLRLLDLKAKPG